MFPPLLPHSFVGDIQRILVNSTRQRLIDKYHTQFDGQVEVLIDQKLHIWADHVTIDKKKNELVAWTDVSGTVVIEDAHDTVITADRVVFNFIKETGWADRLTIRIARGYLSAEKAEKKADQCWQMYNMAYSPCDAPRPHWDLRAGNASLFPNGLLKANDLVFRLENVPLLWFPWLTIPAQGQTKSGFLVPKFSYDYQAGVGVKEAFYIYCTPHLDTTFTVDWQDRKGVVLSNELRWARGAQNTTFINADYAFVKNVFEQKGDQIVLSSARRYWVHGDTMRLFKGFASCQASSLARMDFGTDKRFTYLFSNNTDDVDDMFSNSFIVRTVWPKHMYEFRINSDETSRTYLLLLSQEEKQQQARALAELYKANPEDRLFDQATPATIAPHKARETKVSVVQLPHLSGASTFYNWVNLVNYRHDFFVDQISYRQQENQCYFADQFVIDNEPIVPFDKAGLLRMYYQGHVHKAACRKGNVFSWDLCPQVQIRSKTQHHVPHQRNVIEAQRFGFGAYRALVTSDLTWSLPPLTVWSKDRDIVGDVAPRLTWSYIPKFDQQHWYDMDRYDRLYSKNECTLSLDAHSQMGDHTFDATVRQGYDFYRSDAWFALRRPASSDAHLCPLRSDINYSFRDTSFTFAHEHDWTAGKLLQVSVDAATTFKQASASIGYLYQSSALQRQRELLSTIPHFVLMKYTIPLGQHATFSYDGQFCAEVRAHFLALKPIIHRLRFDYQGHCWGFYIGFEEKKYREYGNPKTEHYIVFALRLESLGSFANKIRPPTLEHEKIAEPLPQA